jgi:hypothetical protein
MSMKLMYILKDIKLVLKVKDMQDGIISHDKYLELLSYLNLFEIN